MNTIGKYAFAYCDNLASIQLPSSLTELDTCAFYYCTSLNTISIPNGLTRIGAWAFDSCVNLSSITLPESLTTIEKSAFRYCKSLTSIVIPDNVTSIGDYAFAMCIRLTSIKIPYRVTAINEGLFYNCSNLSTVNINDNVTSIGDYAFYKCSSLNAISIPSGVTNIGYAAFWNVPLRNVYSRAELPPTLGQYAFSDFSAKLFVPCSTVPSYQEATYWENFNHIKGVYFEDVEATICEGNIYTENGFNANLTGIYFKTLYNESEECDRVITLYLTVNPAYNITINASIEEGAIYEENGFDVNQAGQYTQTLQTIDGCDSIVTLNLTFVGLRDVLANAVEVSLYPNPANAYTTLKVEGLKEQTPVYLFDIQGRKLKEYVLNAAQQTLRIDLGDLPKGVYTIMLGNVTKKLIVE